MLDGGGTVIDNGSNITAITTNSLPPGDYTVIVDANSAAAEGAFSLTIESIKAQFSASPTVGCAAPTTVFFTDTSIDPVTWAWEFGDGGTSSSQNPIHSYTASGEFTVELTITDPTLGLTDSYTETINVSVLNTDFTATSSFGCGPLSVNFTDASAVAGPGTITNWAWTFGNGATSSDQNPSYVYDNPGTYTVSLTTTSSLGCTKTRTKTNFIQVIGPDVQFTATNTGNDYTFTNVTISGSPVISRLWTFGDGATSTDLNPTHTYTAAGVYDVSLTVNDLDGCSRTLTKTNFANTISGAFDVSQAIFTGDHERFSVGAALPRSLAFNPDGTKMFVLDASDDAINEYDLSSAYDVSTAVFAGDSERFSVAAQETSPRSVAFNTNGTKMFVMGFDGDDINEYDLATGFDISTAIYAGNGERFSVAAQETHPNSLTFNDDGTKMYVAGSDDDEINQYTLSAAFDVSTAVYQTTLSVSAQELFPQSIAFVDNGSKLLVMGSGGDDINEYNLTTAFDISTASYAGDAERLSVAGQDTQPNSFTFNASGTQLFVAGIVGQDINVYSLASPVIIGATANQAINDNSSIDLFSTITVQDPNSDNVSATITLDDNAKGVLTGAGLSGTGPYTLASTDAASLQAGLRTLVFSPTENRAPISETTTFTLVVSDGSFSDTDNITTVVSNAVAPTTIISSTAPDPTNAAFTATFTFSEAVTGFVIGDISVGNGTASNFTATSALVYTALITPTTDGTVTVDVAADVAQDGGGDGNTAATQFSIEADLTAPTTTITSAATDPINAAFTATFTFSEAVTGFVIGDISVGNGTASNFTATSALVYTALITPTTDGTVTVDVAANVAQDVVGNGNIAATQFSIEADLTAPTTTITSGATDPTNAAFTVTFTFSEEVTGFGISDISVGNGTASDFTTISALIYTALITPTAEGTITIDVAGDVVQDAAGNGNTAAAQFSIETDLTPPIVTISSATADPTNAAFTATFTFSEAVTGFVIGDISIGNGTVSNFTATNALEYTALITPTMDGTVTVDIAPDVAQDEAGNGNTAATQFSIEYDGSVAAVICQDITIQLDANGVASIEASQIDNGSSDNYGIASMDLDITTFDCNNIGDNQVTLTITDVNGNTGTCVAVVTVDDTTPPIVMVRDITLPLNENGQASITVDDIDNGSSDNCGIASRNLDILTFDTPATASTTVTLTVTDFSGNVASGTATITFGKVSQTILFDPLPDKKVGADPVTLQATGGGSGLPVTFSITTEPASGVASLIDGMIILESPGMVTVTANQAGNDIFAAATAVSRTFKIESNGLFLPTLFSPNDDEVNDRFILRGGGNIATIEFKIFDRDNNLIFSSNSVTDLSKNGWDGGGQPQDVYMWVVKGSFSDGNPILINGKNTGFIRLAR